jgi:ComF family protein
MAVPRALGVLADVLLPPLCVHCGEPLSTARPGVCRWCRATLRPLAAGCRRCSLPLPGTPADCGRCRDWPPGLTAVAAVRYAGAAESIAHALKYRGWTHLADLCAAAMVDALGDRAAGLGVLVPVPLHPARLAERGFNQAELLAAPCAARWRLPVLGRALVRTRPTPPQTDLDAAARRANVRNAFAVPRPAEVQGRRLLLVDDVLTTGATADAAAQALRAAGAAAVGVLALARVVGR